MIKFARFCPIRLVAQDVALSRLKQGFESPMGHPENTALPVVFLFTMEFARSYFIIKSEV